MQALPGFFWTTLKTVKLVGDARTGDGQVALKWGQRFRDLDYGRKCCPASAGTTFRLDGRNESLMPSAGYEPRRPTIGMIDSLDRV